MLNGIRPSPQVLNAIQSIRAGSDLLFANLEAPLTTARARTTRKPAAELQQRAQWILKADPKHAPFIASSGISIVGLANNHAMDYGATGLAEMLAALDAARVSHAGAGANWKAATLPAIVTLPGGKRIALLAALGFMTRPAILKTTPATHTGAGISVLNLGGRLDKRARGKLTNWIASARTRSDFVVVGMHWGVERKSLPTAYQVALGRALIDAGADIVWGAHPHVLQGAELYKGHLIMYSMGNLISNLPAEVGFIKVSVGDDGGQSVSFIPAKDSGGRLRLKHPRESAHALREMRALCRLLLRRYPSAVSVPAL